MLGSRKPSCVLGILSVIAPNWTHSCDRRADIRLGCAKSQVPCDLCSPDRASCVYALRSISRGIGHNAMRLIAGHIFDMLLRAGGGQRLVCRMKKFHSKGAAFSIISAKPKITSLSGGTLLMPENRRFTYVEALIFLGFWKSGLDFDWWIKLSVSEN